MSGGTRDVRAVVEGETPSELLSPFSILSETSVNVEMLRGPAEADSILRLKGDDREIASPSAPSPCLDLEYADPLPLPTGPRRLSRVATEFCTISYLVFFSMMGTLARLGLQALTTYPGAPILTGVLWANFGGSMILGFLIDERKLFGSGPVQSKPSSKGKQREDQTAQLATPGIRSNHQIPTYPVKTSVPFYIGLATGFCGSFTSFSAFIRDAFLALSNSQPEMSVENGQSTGISVSPVPRNAGYGVLAVLAAIILTPTVSLGALHLGGHLALALEYIFPSKCLPVAPRWVDGAMILVAWISWVGAILMAIWPPDRPGTAVGRSAWSQERWRGDGVFALVFAPLGCLLRFYASIYLNGMRPSFPVGTFAVNMGGTVMSAIFFDLQHIPIGEHVGCQVLQGAMDGFCGSLTTISTWVVELRGLPLRESYFYGPISVAVGLGLTLIIMGSLRWTAGFQPPLCLS